MADIRYFVDVFKELIDAVVLEYDPTNNEKPYFIHDHLQKISEILSQKDQASLENYPLICLIEDFPEDHGDSLEYSYKVNFSILIVTSSTDDITSAERYELNVKTILQPILDLLLTAIEDSSLIKTQSLESIKYTKIVRPNWGSPDKYGNKGLIFNDYLDGIQIDFKDIKVNFQFDCEALR